MADDLVQATCLRAIERADQFVPGTRVDRWLLAILRSIWLNEIRSRKIREGGGFVDPEDALTTDGAREIEMNITAAAVLRAIDRLPEAQRETVLLVYGEGLHLCRSGGGAGHPDRDGHEPACHRASCVGEAEIGAFFSKR